MTSMTPLPELHTERLLLRPFRPADVDAALAYRNDGEFARYLPHIPQPFTREDAQRFVETNMTVPWDQCSTFAIEFEGRLIGTVTLEIDSRKQSAMVGYAIGRMHWGKGIATEATRAVIAWGCETFDLARVWASTDARHVRSRRVMAKLGLRHEGTLRSDHAGRGGERVDEVVYGMLRDEWEASRVGRTTSSAVDPTRFAPTLSKSFRQR